MNNSDVKFHILVAFNQPVEGLHLVLVDGDLQIIYAGYTSQLDMFVEKGIYRLKVNLIDYYQEYLLIVDADKTFHFDFDYPSVAPILSFKATHDYLCKNLEAFSIQSTNPDTPDRPNFLFFGAKYDKNTFPELVPVTLLTSYSILSSTNEILIEFNTDNTRFNNEEGWFIFSGKLDNGLYFLKANGTEDPRIFPFYIYDHYQTQFMIRYHNKADMENCFFFYSNKQSFRREAEEYLVLDKIMYAFKDYKNFQQLTDSDHGIIREHPFLVTLVRALQILATGENTDFTDCEFLPLPDLELLAGNKQLIELNNLLPVLSAVMTRFAVNENNSGINFEQELLIDMVIDYVKYDLYWNNFSQIDAPYSNLTGFMNRLDELTRSFITHPYIINVKGNTYQERLIQAVTRLIATNQTKEAIKLLTRADSISTIAQQLNLPTSQVFRNFDTYNDIYNKMNPTQ